MAKQFDAFDESHRSFVAQQPMFFVGTAAAEGRVNVSPKGMDSLRILSPNRLIWLNLTGSGNETAGHLQRVNRMTVMWCSFSTRPLILRAYGTARTLHPRDADWAALKAEFPDHPGARQIYDMQVDLVQTSCGYAVPFLEFKEERPVLRKWAEDRGEEGVADYWDTRNRSTIDGFDTGIMEP
ncbi:pyridoxamine 5'-phosphate oxidase family protein [Phaeobacter sp. HF9A]|uniref:pyridoxamine 5'-phosphate oxidase family protein n=1 Tax=Phaeobacter sp. HF9A TaxID=2721561 RepID=UPI00142F5BC8|nr:pyridoxamine 5'-phosphate oxidase family protein [Phaeobacter sp. HF9A]NIZ12373.1 pyridoxamine 5'-phosphate oxidase family protein [Phaeobacter sp. HF9A]